MIKVGTNYTSDLNKDNRIKLNCTNCRYIGVIHVSGLRPHDIERCTLSSVEIRPTLAGGYRCRSFDSKEEESDA